MKKLGRPSYAINYAKLYIQHKLMKFDKIEAIQRISWKWSKNEIIIIYAKTIGS